MLRRFHFRDAPPPPPEEASPPPDDEAPTPLLEDVSYLFHRHASNIQKDIDEHDLRRCLGYDNDSPDDDTDDGGMFRRRRPQRNSSQRRRDDQPPPSPRRFTLAEFHRILFSPDDNPPLRRRHRVYHDMTLPLSHYFIYSAHNPYLQWPPDQRRGSGSGRSDEAIIRALKMGVRAIEVAMWPNSNEDDIKIHHGWTQYTPVLLTECLKSIKEYAFVASPYPVIITLEDNLKSSSKLQKKAAKVLLDVLGDVLYWPQVDFIDSHGNAYSNNDFKLFPSPDELMGAVLLSTKPPNSLLKKNKGKPVEVDVSKVPGTIEQGDVSKGADDDDAAWGPEVPVFQSEKIQSAHQKEHDGGVLVHPRWRNDDYDGETEKKMQPHEYPLYRHLITVGPYKVLPSRTIAKKKIERLPIWEPEPEIKPALETEPGKGRRLSWSKQQIEKEAEYCGTDIVRFTQRNILSIYPSVSIKGNPRAPRLTSSNYNPFVGWVHGAQMVALNMQEYGRALWLMHGFYRANGGCGYVRKPDFLMQTEPMQTEPETVDDFLMQEPEIVDPRKPRPEKTTLRVKVYMGDGWLTDFKRADTSFIPDLWASVGIAGVPADTTAMKKTKATEKTWVPVWEDEFSFPLMAPEIALLRVEVHQYDMSEKDVFGGQTVLPVSELRPGIRAVPLFDRQGNRFDNVRLLMRFGFDDRFSYHITGF